MSLNDIVNCHLYSGSTTRYICALRLQRELCWKMMNISVKFGNEGGQWSGYSAPALLDGVSKSKGEGLKF